MFARALQTLRELRPTAPRGPFPGPAWAWPTGDRDLLLQAAILPDLERAAAAYRTWQRTFDFEDVDFMRQRLLVAVAARIPPSLLGAAEQARLSGVERQLWARAMLGLRAARPLLAALAAAGVDMLVFKGAADAVLDYANSRGRHASDLDVLVHPQSFERAWDVAIGMGWRKMLEHHRPERMIGINLVNDQHGDIDLHKYAFHQLLPGDNADRGMWERASRHVFLEQQVWVPSPTDRLVLSIAHGGIGSHDQSDWMIDAARMIQTGLVDWQLFATLVAQRRLDIFAHIALTYLAGPMGLDVPLETLATLRRHVRAQPFHSLLGLLLARPRTDHWAGSSLARTVARRIRGRRGRKLLAQLEAQRRTGLDRAAIR